MNLDFIFSLPDFADALFSVFPKIKQKLKTYLKSGKYDNVAQKQM